MRSTKGEAAVAGIEVWGEAEAPRTLELSNIRASALAFTPDGKQLIVGCLDGSILLWNPDLGDTGTLRGHFSAVTAVAFDATGQRLVTGSRDETIKLWNLATTEEVLTLRGLTGGIVDVSFDTTGKFLLALSSDGTLRSWDGTPFK